MQEVVYPGQDLELVAAAGLEHEQVARERIALQHRPHDAGKGVDPLAPVHGPDGDKYAATGEQAQHDAEHRLGTEAHRMPHNARTAILRPIAGVAWCYVTAFRAMTSW